MLLSSRRRLVCAAALACATAVASVQSATVAVAAPVTVSGATLAWGLSAEQGGGAFFGGCNFLSAGTAGNTGSSRLWTQADGFYKTAAGNVVVQKPDATGRFVRPTWTTKCQDPNGTPVTASSTTSTTGNRVLLSEGTGTVNQAAGTARIRWTGSFTSAFYGGLTYWTAANPVLTVAGGTGTLTATLSGYGADRDDPSQWERIAPRAVVIATLRGITLGSNGFATTPVYKGVAVTTPSSATAQTPKTTANRSWWGSFPQPFVDFQQLTGQSSYWFASGGTRDAAKPTTPVSVRWTV